MQKSTTRDERIGVNKVTGLAKQNQKISSNNNVNVVIA